MTQQIMSRTQQQALVDAAHLILLLHTAKQHGLVNAKGVVDVDECNAVLERGVEADCVPRHDLLEPAKLLTSLSEVERFIKIPAKAEREYVVAHMQAWKRPKALLTDFRSLWTVTSNSQNNGLYDVGICHEGVAIRMEGQWFVVPPQELFAGVAEAYGLPVQREMPIPRQNGEVF